MASAMEEKRAAADGFTVQELENSLSVMEMRISRVLPATPVHQASKHGAMLTLENEAANQYGDLDETDHYTGRLARNLKKKLELLDQYRHSNPSVPAYVYSRTGIKRRKRSRYLSSWGWLFLILAFIQAFIVIGLQIAIAILGNFQAPRLEQYVECVEEQYNITLPENATYPSFGSDKQIYVYIFVFLILYNFLLCVYAMLAQRIVEVFTFVVINLFTIGYSSLQVFQFRGFGQFCDPITTVGWLALVNVLVVIVFNVFFGLLLFKIYSEFGWKVYKFVNCNPALRYHYRVYEIFLSLVKLVIIFTITFLVGQMALILETNDPEFWLSLPYILAMIAFFFYVFFMVRRESHLAMATMLVIGILLFCYYIFKIYRYASRSCPVCIKRSEEIERQRVEGQIIDDDRREDFQHLIMMAVLNDVIVLAYLICLFRVWKQFGHGLADHFYIRGHWFDRIGKKKPNEDAYKDSLGTGTMMKKVPKDSIRSNRQFSKLDIESPMSPKFPPNDELFLEPTKEDNRKRSSSLPAILVLTKSTEN